MSVKHCCVSPRIGGSQMSDVSPNHPTMLGGGFPADRPARHTGSGWCGRCQTSCLLLDNTELYGADMYHEIEEDDEFDE